MTIIKSYLTGRHQRVILGQLTDGNNSSKLEMIKYGDSHSSILGLYFYILYK
jgi:hypothetical protein